jgi:hypothetical protein
MSWEAIKEMKRRVDGLAREISLILGLGQRR